LAVNHWDFQKQGKAAARNYVPCEMDEGRAGERNDPVGMIECTNRSDWFEIGARKLWSA